MHFARQKTRRCHLDDTHEKGNTVWSGAEQWFAGGWREGLAYREDTRGFEGDATGLATLCFCESHGKAPHGGEVGGAGRKARTGDEQRARCGSLESLSCPPGASITLYIN